MSRPSVFSKNSASESRRPITDNVQASSDSVPNLIGGVPVHFAGGESLGVLTSWLDEAADSLDQSFEHTDLLDRLAAQRLTRIGVPEALGGDGGTAADMVESIALLAQHSLVASFVLWSQRSYIEFLLKSDNHVLRERELPALLAGQWAGSIGISNAMKFASGIESLEIIATPLDHPHQNSSRLRVDGVLPWVTNLRANGFSVAAGAQLVSGGPISVYAFRSTQRGVRRSDDLALIGLRGSDVAAVRLEDVAVAPDEQLHEDLNAWLPHIRPQFLGFQYGMSIGLARASIAAAQEQAGRRTVLQPQLAQLDQALQADTGELLQGLQSGRFSTDTAALFRLRISLARHVRDALFLELQAWGGRAYLEHQAPGFARRWRESALVPVITPSLVQLKMQLALLDKGDGTTSTEPV